MAKKQVGLAALQVGPYNLAVAGMVGETFISFTCGGAKWFEIELPEGVVAADIAAIEARGPAFVTRSGDVFSFLGGQWVLVASITDPGRFLNQPTPSRGAAR